MLIEEKYHACVEGLASFARGIGMTDAVIGLSGGIDSSLVACMCVDAFGAEHVHGYMLPGPYSSEHSLVDAQELALNLGIRAERISIGKPFEAFVDALGDHCIMARGLAAENTQARCRMTVLMARWVNEEALRKEGRILIPERVLTKPPSAELAPDQRDEDTLGSYDELDRLLIDYCERGMDRSALIAAGYDAAEVDRVKNRVDSYAFKRALEPPFPAIEYGLN